MDEITEIGEKKFFKGKIAQILGMTEKYKECTVLLNQMSEVHAAKDISKVHLNDGNLDVPKVELNKEGFDEER